MIVVHDFDFLSPSCSVENSEYLSDLLKEQNIPHNVLNARPKVNIPLIVIFSFACIGVFLIL